MPAIFGGPKAVTEESKETFIRPVISKEHEEAVFKV
jgi:hypothetical protein